MNIALYIELYDILDDDRRKEIDFVLKKNCENKYITSINVFCFDDCIFRKVNHDKIKYITVTDRCTFEFMFNYINKNSDADYNIMANCDIFYDDTLCLLDDDLLDKDEIIALLRYEYINENNIVSNGNCATAQDSWIFRTLSKLPQCNHYLGVLGCDNRLIHELYGCGFNLYNFAKEIKSYHVHNVKIRSYKGNNKLKGPYGEISPMFIEDKDIFIQYIKVTWKR